MKQFTIDTAKKAGQYLLQNFKKDKSLLKERGVAKDLSTKYDKESDRIIIEQIKSKYPDHNILTEESGEFNNNSNYTWIVDSLDGTSNFAAQNPFFSVSIALVKNNKPILGVVYAPFLDELFYAEEGKGAFRNNQKIKVSDINKLSSSYLVACEGGDKTNERLAQLHAKIHPTVKDMRKLGSAAIEGCFVASGRADAYFTLNIAPWDIAAAIIIVQEAGGKVTLFNGKEWTPKRQDVILSNGLVHEEIIKLVR